MDYTPAEVTWKQLATIEPRLKELYKEVKAVKDPGGPSFCANALWYDDFRERLYSLVGWEAENRDPLIITSWAFDLVYDKLYNLLPPCRGCNCIDWG